jgi:hypothetical protein
MDPELIFDNGAVVVAAINGGIDGDDSIIDNDCFCVSISNVCRILTFWSAGTALSVHKAFTFDIDFLDVTFWDALDLDFGKILRKLDFSVEEARKDIILNFFD